jgi:hypothetical protein
MNNDFTGMSGTNEKVRSSCSTGADIKLNPTLHRATIGTLSNPARKVEVFATPTGSSSLDCGLVVAHCVLSDGSYFYKNPNGSTYYDSGRGFTKYTAPNGDIRKTYKHWSLKSKETNTSSESSQPPAPPSSPCPEASGAQEIADMV